MNVCKYIFLYEVKEKYVIWLIVCFFMFFFSGKKRCCYKIKYIVIKIVDV